MLDHDTGAARDRWYGAQEAARFLGVHRSTLHIAVRQGLIVPDQYTPGRHARFKRETLEAFRVRLADHAATSDTGSQTAVHVLANLAGMLVRSSKADELASAAIAGIRRTMPQVGMCCIAVLTDDTHDRDRTRLLAQYGFPDWAIDDYNSFRSTFRFAAAAAMRSLCPQICADIATEDRSPGSEHLLRLLRMNAYAVVPILAGEEPLGVVICLYARPHAFTEVERTFLSGIADELATALSNTAQLRQLTDTLTMSRELMRHALSLRADTPLAGTTSNATTPAVSPPERALGDLFRRLSGAEEVCALGFGCDLPTRNPHLLDIACQACAGEEVVQSQWSQNGVPHTGLGASVPLATDVRAAVAAAWPGRRTLSDSDQSLLVTFAGAYVVATSVS